MKFRAEAVILKSEIYNFHRLDLSRQAGFVITIYDEDGLRKPSLKRERLSTTKSRDQNGTEAAVGSTLGGERRLDLGAGATVRVAAPHPRSMHSLRRAWHAGKRLGHVSPRQFEQRLRQPPVPGLHFPVSVWASSRACWVRSAPSCCCAAQLLLQLRDCFVESACGGRNTGSVKQDVARSFDDQWHR
jgi:hypothetical protein